MDTPITLGMLFIGGGCILGAALLIGYILLVVGDSYKH